MVPATSQHAKLLFSQAHPQPGPCTFDLFKQSGGVFDTMSRASKWAIPLLACLLLAGLQGEPSAQSGHLL